MPGTTLEVAGSCFGACSGRLVGASGLAVLAVRGSWAEDEKLVPGGGSGRRCRWEPETRWIR